MKMSTLLMMFFLVLTTFSRDETKMWAMMHGANVSTKLLILDEKGASVSNVHVTVVFADSLLSDKYSVKHGNTNIDGIYNVSGRCKYEMSITASKEGYYTGWENVDFANSSENPSVLNGTWVTPSNGYVIVLNKVKNPTEHIYCPHKSTFVKVPAFGKWIGYDMEKWDFCRPYGEGDNHDMLLLFNGEFVTPRNYKSSMEVSFTNNPYAGVYKMKKNPSSALVYGYEANTMDNVYCDSLNFFSECIPGGTPTGNNLLSSDEYYVVRTRTKVDDKGKLLTAHYGIISTKWSFGRGAMILSLGWFKPEANNIILEDLKMFSDMEERRKANEKKLKE